MTITNVFLLIYFFFCTISDIRIRKISLIQSLLFFIIGIIIQILQTSSFSYVILSLIPGLFIMVFSVISSGHIGIGDGIMITMIGLYLGFIEVPIIIFFSCIFVLFYAGMSRFIRKKQFKEVPFAPFLLVSCIIIIFL